MFIRFCKNIGTIHSVYSCGIDSTMEANQQHRREFQAKKRKILRDLASDESDASPKGNVDTHIRSLIRQLNNLEGVVTTSSCSGRISCFLEGQKALPNDAPNGDGKAGFGGKGGGGRWLYVSHDPIQATIAESEDDAVLRLLFDNLQSHELENVTEMSSSFSNNDTRYVHLNFEPMVSYWYEAHHKL